MLVAWVVWVIGSIVLHELAHGWAAIREGDTTPIDTGHMTWNPLVHMGPMSLLMFALVGIAWGAMPVNPSRFRSRYGDAIVSFAGPAMNLTLALISGVAAALWSGYASGIGEPLFSNFEMFFTLGAVLNVVLAVFNLLPLPPLDGAHILASFSMAYRGLINHPHAPIISLFVLILLFGRLGDVIIGPVGDFTRSAITSVQNLLPGADKALDPAMLERVLSDLDKQLGKDLGEHPDPSAPAPPPSPAP